jgi:hypothetical protein
MDSAYSEAPVSPPDKAPAADAPEESVDEENAGEAEILIGKDKLPAGTKEGDTCTFKVSQDVGDEYVLEYVKENGDGTEPTNESLEQERDQELSAIDSQGA